MNWSKSNYWICEMIFGKAYVFECIEDSSNLAFLSFEMVLFCQPIPLGDENRFDLLDGSSDFLE